MRVIIISLVLLAAPLSLAAQERQFADIIYTPIDGWVPGREDEGNKVFYSDLPNDRCEFCSFHISASVPDRGSLAAFLDANLTLFEDPDDRDRFDPAGPHKELTVAGYPARMQGYRFGRRAIYMLIALDLGDRKTLLGFRGNFYDDDELRDVGVLFASQVAPFFDNLTFVTTSDDLLLPAATPGNMSGVWWGWDHGFTVGIDNTMRTTIDQKVLVFYPDGHVYRGAPPTGITTMDRDTVAGAFDANLGVYTHLGARRITITYLDGAQETLTWDRSERGWDDGDIIYQEVSPLPDGTTISGTLSDFNYTGFTPGGGVEGGVASGSSTTFTRDSGFTGDSFGSVSAIFGGGSVIGSNSRDQQGQYVIQDGLIIMTDQSGDTTAEIIFQTDKNILIGDQFLDTQ